MRLLPAILVLAVLLPSALAAQTPPPAPAAGYIGKTIVAIRLEGEGKAIDDPKVVELVETRAGQPLSMTDVRESIAHLFGLGRFQDVQVDASEAPGGVTLRYNLIPLHSVQSVEFRGRAGLDEGLLRQTVTNRFGAAPPVGRAAEVARTLEQLYRDRGYLRATVRPIATEKHDPDRTLLEFDIDAGPRAVVAAVDVQGDPLQNRDTFLREAHAAPSDPYEPSEIDRRLADFVQRLKKRGRYEASATYRARPSADAATVDLTITVDPGPLVAIVFHGDPVPRDKISDLVPVEREGSVDQDLIEDSIQRIKSYLNQQGYWKADVQTDRQEADGRLTIVFTVQRGLQYRIAEGGVDIVGNRAVPLETLRAALARLQPGDVFVESNLGQAVSAIAGLYQRLGYARAKVSAAENEATRGAPGGGRVKPVITIVEGALSLVGAITFAGARSLTEDQLNAVIGSKPGEPYYEPRVVSDRDALILEYRNRGFASADVVVVPAPSADGTRVDLKYNINEGEQTLVDQIVIIGNTRTDERIIRRELLLQEGKPLGLEDQIESQRRLGALGLFRRITIEPLSHGGGSAKDVLVTVEEATPTTLSYGGGLEVAKQLASTGIGGPARERFEFAPRGFFDIGRRNIAGKNRSVDLYTRLSLRPEKPSLDGSSSGGNFGFSEYRIVGTYREPRALGVNGDLSFTAAVEQGVRTTFNFARKGVNAEFVRRLSPGVRTSVRYSFGTTRTFDEDLTFAEQAAIDRIFPQVRLSGFAGAISRDTRDDVLEPSRGMFFSAEGSIAARALGGQVGFLKSYVQGFLFRQLPFRRRVIFATRVAIGLADGFPRTVTVRDDLGGELPTVVEDLPASERFFAGGDTTIRGFAFDTVGAPNTISPTGFPKGGNAVVVMNGELRVQVWGDLGAATFIDGGNVFNRASELDFGELRGSVGFGLRYRSPIGPIRFDVGFKLDRRQLGTGLESRRAFHFSIGQAF